MDYISNLKSITLKQSMGMVFEFTIGLIGMALIVNETSVPVFAGVAMLIVCLTSKRFTK